MINKTQQPIDKKKGRTSGFIPIKKIIDDVMMNIVNKRRSDGPYKSENIPMKRDC